MALEIIPANISSSLDMIMTNAFANIPGFNTIIQISKAVGIAVIVYLVILMVKAIIQARQSMRLKLIAKNVEEINSKLDLLVGKKSAARKVK